MKLVRDLTTILSPKPTVVCMGNFDGMHQGHQMMIQATVQLAKDNDYVSTVILFEPHPKEFFMQDKAPARLMRLSDKVVRLKLLGVDQVVCLKFNEKLSSMSPDSFIQTVLVKQLNMKAIVISEGARFGYKQAGDVALLEKLSVSLGFEVVMPEKLLNNDVRVSSTRIRQLLEEGNCGQVAELLGHPYTMIGRIIHGNQLGRTLGFPTINIACQRKTVALSGIFTANVTIESCDQVFRGVAHIARRSIVNDQKPILEVHIFNFNQDVYGKRASVSFLHKIRDTQSVSDLSELKQLIQHDSDEARQYFNGPTVLHSK
jgi:riboflavin kinase/FMN adenylyltransferase